MSSTSKTNPLSRGTSSATTSDGGFGDLTLQGTFRNSSGDGLEDNAPALARGKSSVSALMNNMDKQRNVGGPELNMDMSFNAALSRTETRRRAFKGNAFFPPYFRGPQGTGLAGTTVYAQSKSSKWGLRVKKFFRLPENTRMEHVYTFAVWTLLRFFRMSFQLFWGQEMLSCLFF